MSRIIDLPSKDIGTWLLKGWVLTDEQCITPGCPIPLMRSTDGKQRFCVRCDGGPSETAQKVPTSSTKRTESPISSTPSTPHSRASTPATDLQIAPESLAFELPPPSEESIRRRDQSDRAARDIGQRMLRGWAMLADECPNDSCYGVPLVRPPPSIHANKECVICGTIFKTERDAQGYTHLLPLEPLPSIQPVTGVPTSGQDVTSSKHSNSKAGPAPAPPGSTVPFSSQVTKSTSSAQAPESSSPAVSATVTALEHALQALSGHMELLSGADMAALEVVRIGESASQMMLVLSALKEAKTLLKDART